LFFFFFSGIFWIPVVKVAGVISSSSASSLSLLWSSLLLSLFSLLSFVNRALAAPARVFRCWLLVMTDLYRHFSLLLYDFFSPSPLKPCGFSTFLIMMQKVPFSPNLYTTA
jgi:hypothetical protein